MADRADPVRPLERAAGVVTGTVTEKTTPRLGSSRSSPAEALAGAVLAPLCRPPCLVSFSGGLDSSLVLGVAVRVAREEGLRLPIPITWRFADAPRAEESLAQERVVRALGLADWECLQAGDELDWVGVVASRVLARHGLLHPPNTHLHAPLLERAGGGSLLTGIGGDQILIGLRRVGWRRRIVRRPLPPHPRWPWLRPEAERQVRRAWWRERLHQPRRFDRRVEWHLRRRDLRLTLESMDLVAADTGTFVAHPLVDPGFVGALAAAGGAEGFGPRPAALRRLFAGVVPAEVVQARRKATFEEVFWRGPARRLIEDWDGAGVDLEVVDAAGLTAEWAKPFPDLGTVPLLQQVLLQQGMPAAATP